MRQITGLYVRYEDNKIEEIISFAEFKEIFGKNDGVQIGYHDHPIEFTFDDCFLYPINENDYYDTFDYIRTETDFLELFRDFGSNGLEFLDSLPSDLRISDSFNNSDYSVEDLKRSWKIQEKKELEY